MSDHQGEVFWFHKVKLLLGIFRAGSLSFIISFDTYWAINEMMIQFCGPSFITHHMKNKPVREGYKEFVLIYSEMSFVLRLTPDGMSAGSEGRGANEMERDSLGEGNIQSAI
eukprot:10473371-Ditylum_brightwellii.AAC.1